MGNYTIAWENHLTGAVGEFQDVMDKELAEAWRNVLNEWGSRNGQRITHEVKLRDNDKEKIPNR